MDEVQRLLSQVGEWFSDDRVKTGAGVVGGALLAIVVGWFRKKRPERTRINIDCSPGEKLFVQLGEDEPETAKER